MVYNIPKLKLVEIHMINSNHSLFKECGILCFKSKNLYNSALYEIKNHFDKEGTYLNYHGLNKKFLQENNPDYRTLPSKVSQQILMLLDKNFKSYFAALKCFKINPKKFKSEPKVPMYKHKTKGRNILIYTNQAINKMCFKREGLINLSGTNIKFRSKIDYNKIQQVRIIPTTSSYKIEVVYEKQEENLKIDNGKYCGIDVGLNNLFSVCFNNKESNNIIINGRPLKSINQYYNKRLAQLKSKLKNNQKTSKRIKILTEKRNNKIKDYVHKSTKILVNELKQNDVCKVIIGKNDNWKQEINIGSKNNQNFVSLPHAQAINILSYKLQLSGIETIKIEEQYTSKCSALDIESIEKHEVYFGNRIKRGLFKTKEGFKINADINGAANILRKEIPNAFSNGIEAIVVSPMVLTIN